MGEGEGKGGKQKETCCLIFHFNEELIVEFENGSTSVTKALL